MLTEQPQLLTEVVTISPQPADLERARRMRGVLTEMSLRDEKVLVGATRDRDNRPMIIGHSCASGRARLEATQATRVH